MAYEMPTRSRDFTKSTWCCHVINTQTPTQVQFSLKSTTEIGTKAPDRKFLLIFVNLFCMVNIHCSRLKNLLLILKVHAFNIRLICFCLVLDVRHFSLEFSALSWCLLQENEINLQFGAFTKLSSDLKMHSRSQVNFQFLLSLWDGFSLFGILTLIKWDSISLFWIIDFSKMGLYLSFLNIFLILSRRGFYLFYSFVRGSNFVYPKIIAFQSSGCS